MEHGVHFFDMAAHLAGAPGTAAYSEAWRRPGSGQVDRVLAAVHFGAVPATFYHAFDKPGRGERTEFRLACDRGYIRVLGWMPTELAVEALTDGAGTAALDALAAQATVLYDELINDAPAPVRGRGVTYEAAQHRRLRLAVPAGKSAVYQACVRAGIADFTRAVRDPDYTPAVTLADATASLALALACRDGAVLR